MVITFKIIANYAIMPFVKRIHKKDDMILNNKNLSEFVINAKENF